jgi:hypothetical protein
MAFGDFTVTRASTKNILGSAGLYVSVANNVPAFEFNADGTYRGLLVEPGATNLMLRSQEFNDAAWAKTSVTATANTVASPDGATTADTIAETAELNNHRINGNSNVSITSGTAYTASIFMKKGTGATAPNIMQMSFAGTEFGTVQYANFNINTGVVGNIGVGTVARIQDYGSGWYRCSITFTATSTNAISTGFFVSFTNNNDGLGRAPSYTGVVTSDVFLWQAQLETGSVATSPIVTTAGTASRVADVVSLTGASSLIGQTEGTMFVELEYIPDGTARSFLNLSQAGDDTTRTNNRFLLGTTASNEFEFRTVVGGSVQSQILSGARTASVMKVAGTYAVNDFAFYINGSSIGTDTSGTVPTCANIYLGANILGITQYRGWIRSVALFPTRLANATLESITS